ncbi:MAG TPA: response regulator [Bacteroidales bacterium]|jgi:CheY-like chemotaxis protein|nr:response regulator [Bacteroidota bacterium]HJN05887.1 response regulator [Bacteroidales bacterium]|tara:strand:- start:53 stop:460 length:408 start_codon:yes stop_codon:yes gene_type:complete
MTEWADYQFADKTILVVEDVDTSINFYHAALKKSHVNLLWAKDGQEAVDLVNKYIDRIDLVLLDLYLPYISGFEVLKHLRNINQNVPVVVQTAYLFSGERKTSFSMGANDFISKPVQLTDLLNIISKYLKPELTN